MAGIIASLITGGLALIGVIITNMQSNKKIGYQLEKQQAVTDTKLEELTREVREHNNFAQRIPVIENDILSIKDRLKKVEK